MRVLRARAPISFTRSLPEVHVWPRMRVFPGGQPCNAAAQAVASACPVAAVKDTGSNLLGQARRPQPEQEKNRGVTRD